MTTFSANPVANALFEAVLRASEASSTAAKQGDMEESKTQGDVAIALRHLARAIEASAQQQETDE